MVLQFEFICSAHLCYKSVSPLKLLNGLSLKLQDLQFTDEEYGSLPEDYYDMRSCAVGSSCLRSEPVSSTDFVDSSYSAYEQNADYCTFPDFESFGGRDMKEERVETRKHENECKQLSTEK